MTKLCRGCRTAVGHQWQQLAGCGCTRTSAGRRANANGRF